MSESQSYSPEIAGQDGRGWYIVEGILFIAIGVLAIAMPNVTAFAIEFLLAALFLIGGIARFGYGLFNPQHRWWRLFSGAVYAIAGGAIFIWPIAGLTALLAIVGALLLLEGVFDIAIAFALRPARNWAWMLVAGIISLVLGVLVFAGFPIAGILYLAIVLGASFILYGIAVLAIALNANKSVNMNEKETES